MVFRLHEADWDGEERADGRYSYLFLKEIP
jgi:hypothetical protein